MPTLTLQFEGRTLKEYPVGASMTIGRLPDNTVVIDNPAVSAHHARVFRDGEDVVLEDLRSTNGTFVNDRHVYRHALRNGDVVLVGKHKLVFDRAREVDASPAEPALSGLGDTVYLDTRKHRELLATLRDARAEADRAVPAGSSAGATARAATAFNGTALGGTALGGTALCGTALRGMVPGAIPAGATASGATALGGAALDRTAAGVAALGVAAGSVTARRPAVATLRVIAGRAEQAEYKLDAHTSLIGRSPRALVRLHGWFKPDLAVAIARTGDRYVATPLAGRMRVNRELVRGRHDLADGDVLSVSGLTLQFRLQTHGAPSSSARNDGASPSGVHARQALVARSMSSHERAATCRSLT